MEGDNQADPETQGNQATDGAGEGKEDTPLTVDELKVLVQELTDKNTALTTEGTRKESEIQRLQGITRSLQKQGVSSEALSGIMARLDTMEEDNARLLDALANQSGGYEDQPVKKTHVQMLQERREQAKAKVTPQVDAGQIRFINYAWSQGLDENSQEVTDAIEKAGGDPKEALKLLQETVKSKSDAEIQRRITEGIQEGLKAKGATKSGVENPSAASGAWRSRSPEDKLRLGVTK